ncbi:MAG TPA: threonine synthase [Jatrophihabitans sp.]|nr:threonine synthase [Jatrophihabitans sp.]
MFSYLSHLECARCARHYDADEFQGVCQQCSSPLLARYDLDRLATELSREALGGRRADLWRYHELLPVSAAERVVTMGEGLTPLLALPNAGAHIDVPRLLMKDDAVIPTGSFKARGAAVGVSRAAELGAAAIALPSNGNAGSAWAQYAARAGMSALVAMPEAAPTVCRGEILAAGAELYLVNGHIADCGRMIAETVAARPGVREVSTLKEPYRLEGKKTIGIEIVEQLDWAMPDVIVFPTGGGVGLIGIHKALTELRALGWITGTLPRMVAVQSSGCAPIVRAYDEGAAESEAWPAPFTVAYGINVPKALGDFLILQAVRETDGIAIAIDDATVVSAQRELAALEGEVLCPESAAAFAAIRALRTDGWLRRDEQAVLVNTAAGSRYPDLLPTAAVPRSRPDALPR